MKIAVASGKGGTGKTTISVALALSLDRFVMLLDCDVEEPNCDIFLQSTVEQTLPAYRSVPVFDLEKCTHCGACAELCQFNAIVALKDKHIFFPELCHSCMGCVKLCPKYAVTIGNKKMGEISSGSVENFSFVQGRLLVGEAMTPPLIRKIKEFQSSEYAVLDCPPGTSCALMSSVAGVDFVVIVAEPTPFGVHDLSLIVSCLRTVSIPFAVLINKWGVGNSQILSYCKKERIPILGKILNNRMVAEAYSMGKTLMDIDPSYKDYFQEIIQKIELLIKKDKECQGKK